MVHEFRHAGRALVARPSFSVTAILTLAIGIGATTTMFSVVDAVVLRPLPLRHPERLAVVWETNPRLPLPVMVASPPNLADWRARTRSFDAIGAFQLRSFTVAGAAEPEQLEGARVSSDLLPLARLVPAAGRLFTREDDVDGAPPVVLISSALAERRFGGARRAVGQTLVVDDQVQTIAGVMPAGLEFPPPITLRGLGPSVPRDIWVPLRSLSTQRGAHNLTVIGRLRDGASFDSAQRDLAAVAAALAREFPATNAGWSVRVVPLAEQIVGDLRPALFAFGGAVAFVLLLACANVANLLLVRGVTRRKEIAIRTALGATRGDLVTQLLAEAAILGVSGSVLGSVLAFWAVRAVTVLAPRTMPRIGEVGMNSRVFAFALAAGLVAAGLFGLAPLLQTARVGVAEWLHERGGGAGTPVARRLQHALVIAEVSLALVLLVGAGLLVESFVRLRAMDAGFRGDDVLTAKVMLPPRRYATPDAQANFAEDLVRQLSSLPGIRRAAMTNAAPLADSREGTSFVIEGSPPWPAGQEPHVNWNTVSVGYFDTLGVRVLRGRVFDERDRLDSTPVIVINDTLARRYFAGQDPIGRRVRAGFNSGTAREIVGVVATERHASLAAEPHNGFYVPMLQVPRAGQLTMIVRSASDPAAQATAVRQTVRRIDPSLAVFGIETMSDVVARSVASPRFSTVLLTAFASVALLLAAVGLYGVISHTVSQRTREIGIRMALGASRTAVLQMVVGRGLWLAALGTAIGMVAALLIVRLFAALLFGVAATDLPTYAASGVLLLAVGALASYVPARRAVGIDPVVALRGE